MDIYAISQF